MSLVDQLARREADRAHRRLDQHQGQHERADAALASRRQQRINTALTILGPVATAALIRLLER